MNNMRVCCGSSVEGLRIDVAWIFASGRLGSGIFRTQRVQLTGLRQRAYHSLLPQCLHAGVAQKTAADRFQFLATRSWRLELSIGYASMNSKGTASTLGTWSRNAAADLLVIAEGIGSTNTNNAIERPSVELGD
jgi:hypothetical protein